MTVLFGIFLLTLVVITALAIWLVPGTEIDSTVAGLRILRADVEMPWLPDDRVERRVSGSDPRTDPSTNRCSWLVSAARTEKLRRSGADGNTG